MGIFRFWEKKKPWTILVAASHKPNKSEQTFAESETFHSKFDKGSVSFWRVFFPLSRFAADFRMGVKFHPQVLQLPKDRPQFWSKGRMGAKKMNSNAVRPAWLRLIHWGWDEVWSVSAVSYGSMDPSWNLMDPIGYALHGDSKDLANVKETFKRGIIELPMLGESNNVNVW